MAYTLKSTGLAAEAVSIIAVDQDGTTIKDFKSAARTSAMVIHAEVTRGASTWKGTSQNFFRTLNNGDYDFKGIDFTDAQAIPWNNSTGAPGTGTFIAYAGADLARGNGAILAQAALGGLRISGGKLANSYGGGTGRGTTTIPSDLTTKFSAGMNFTYGGAEQWFYGLESGEIVADGSESDAGFGANNPLRYLGGDPGQGTAPGKFHVIVIVPRPLTLTEYQSLHNDWFGTLFEASANAAPTFPGPNIADISATQNVAITADTVSDSFSDTDTLTFSAIGSWPAGITVTSAGVIQGTPTATGTFTNLKVRATDTAAQTVDSNTFQIVVTAPGDTTVPTLTGSITASNITANSFKLDWPAGSDNVAVAGYEYSLNGGTNWTDAGNALTVTPIGLTASTSYPVRVRAYDAAGNRSTPPLSSTVTTAAASGDTTAPTQTGSITVSNVTSSSFKLTWPAASDNVGVFGYEVSIDGGATYTNVGNVLTITETGRPASTAHQVRVRAYDEAGNRSTPLAGTATTLAAVAGTITSDEYRNWSGDLLTGLTVENVVVLTMNRTLALALTNQVTNGEGRVVIANNAALVSGTDYMLASYSPDGEDRGFKKVRAT